MLQKFIYVDGNYLDTVNTELEKGWVVKNVTSKRVAITGNSNGMTKEADSKFLILLQKD